jgi:hypothetical protein
MDAEEPEVCDMCQKQIMPDEGRYGGVIGVSRHWNCHVAKHGPPLSTKQIFDGIKDTFNKMRTIVERVKKHGRH